MSASVSYDTLKKSPAQDANEETPSQHRSHKKPTKPTKSLPTRWKPPKSFVPRLIFHVMCFCLTLHSNLDFMWEIFQEPKGWESFHIKYLVQLNQLSTVQGLLLTTVAVFISTGAPLQQIVNYDAGGPYTLLSESLVFSLFGLLFQLYISVVGQSYQQQKTFKWLFLCHIMILSIPIYTFAISLLLLLFAISVTGFLSSSDLAQVLTVVTFALLFAYLLVSILPSPFYSRLYGFLWGKRNSEPDDSEDELDGELHEKEGA
ncbi:uncharacterized protein EDB91DRAFT_1256706 [Suillus paluster]|uniref:uncharacterized protein n=1 Tax=Suillus paluster TaxID=48578 RepID=UPI001B872B6C|nr:uncharacterized protein EDB91DRAFT_1256706 [Suillus paluster]KAG1721049.1 hypothetical protein EDB91DRAFT_1256706 [Suillus paluster]